MTASVQFEYEHRWLVEEPPPFDGHFPTVINQAYLFIEKGYCVRVRRFARVGATRETTDTWDTIGVKGPRTGVVRAEEEWDISPEMAMSLYRIAPHKIVKSRYQFVYGDFLWDLDQFHHANEGLFIAECEVDRPGITPTRPPWCKTNITGDNRFDNEQLALHPYPTWA